MRAVSHSIHATWLLRAQHYIFCSLIEFEFVELRRCAVKAENREKKDNENI